MSDASTATAISSSEFQHLVVTYDGTLLSMYLNGELVDSNTDEQSIDDVIEPFTVATDLGNGLEYDGAVDELRVANTPPPNGWIATEFANQNAPAQFYDVGPEEAL